MIDFFQLTFSGLATGCIYALAALGFTLLWQASGTINFATGEFVMLPAFGMLGCMALGLPLWAAFVVTVFLAVIVLGWGFKTVVVNPLIRQGMMPLIVATIGLALVMKNGVRQLYSAEAHPFPNLFGDKIFNVMGVTFSSGDVGTLVFALIISFALQAFINGTITGRAMQAVAQNPESATVLGINVQRMVLYTFAFNAALATAAALLVTPIYLAKFDMGLSLGMKAFLAAIIGGFNNSRGALLGGLIVGVLENWSAAYVSPAYKDAVALVLFFAVIMFKPNGLLGTVETRKV